MYHLFVFLFCWILIIIDQFYPIFDRVWTISLIVLSVVAFMRYFVQGEIKKHREIREKIVQIENTNIQEANIIIGRHIHTFEELNQMFENYTDFIFKLANGKEVVLSCIREDVIQKILRSEGDLKIYYKSGIILKIENLSDSLE